MTVQSPVETLGVGGAPQGACGWSASVVGEIAEVIANDAVNREYRHLVVRCSPVAAGAQPGQFFQLLCPHSDGAQPFLFQGKAAMMLMGTFITGGFPAAVKPNMGYFQFPIIDSKVPTAEDGPVESLHIPSKAKNKADAHTFLAFIETPETSPGDVITLSCGFSVSDFPRSYLESLGSPSRSFCRKRKAGWAEDALSRP